MSLRQGAPAVRLAALPVVAYILAAPPLAPILPHSTPLHYRNAAFLNFLTFPSCNRAQFVGSQLFRALPGISESKPGFPTRLFGVAVMMARHRHRHHTSKSLTHTPYLSEAQCMLCTRPRDVLELRRTRRPLRDVDSKHSFTSATPTPSMLQQTP